jgi:hypothetical protein
LPAQLEQVFEQVWSYNEKNNTKKIKVKGLLANFIIEQLNPLMNGGSNALKHTPIFTDNPGF